MSIHAWYLFGYMSGLIVGAVAMWRWMESMKDKPNTPAQGGEGEK